MALQKVFVKSPQLQPQYCKSIFSKQYNITAVKALQKLCFTILRLQLLGSFKKYSKKSTKIAIKIPRKAYLRGH